MFIRENPNSHFWNFLILSFFWMFTWEISLITHLIICPGYMLGVVGDSVCSSFVRPYIDFQGVHEQFLHLLFTFVYFCEILVGIFTLTIINFVFRCCLCWFSTIFREFWKILWCQKKDRYLQIKKGSVLILLCICSIYKKETLHTRFCMMNGF